MSFLSDTLRGKLAALAKTDAAALNSANQEAQELLKRPDIAEAIKKCREASEMEAMSAGPSLMPDSHKNELELAVKRCLMVGILSAKGKLDKGDVQTALTDLISNGGGSGGLIEHLENFINNFPSVSR